MYPLISHEWAEVYAIIAGDIITLFTLIALILEVRHLKKSIHSSTYQRIYEQMINIDRFFIRRPTLKPYFYDRKEVETNNPAELNELFSIAEMLIDYFDSVYHQQDCMPEDTFPQFSAFMRDLCSNSPLLKDFLNERKEWYPEDFLKHLREDKKP